MKTLLVVAHGSRRQESNEEVRRLAAQLRDFPSDYDRIEPAFLELAEPSIPDGLRKLIAAGSGKVVVLPYFLSAGRHVVDDIPNEVDTVRREFPEIPIHIAPYLGGAPDIAKLLLSQADVTEKATDIIS